MHASIPRKIASAAVAAMSTTAIFVAIPAESAHAASSSCSPMNKDSRTFRMDTAIGKIPFRIYVRMCVEKTGGGHRAHALVGWVGYGGRETGRRTFDDFEVAVALNQHGRAGIKSYCTITSNMNTGNDTPFVCDTGIDRGRGGSWSAGGYINYHLRGKGNTYWGGLHDSPTIN